MDNRLRNDGDGEYFCRVVLASDGVRFVPAGRVFYRIVVDDGSSDATSRVCQAYGNQIQYVRQSNAGPSIARNAGIGLARHSWVAFLDSDDYWTPGHLGRMKTAIRETKGEANFYFSNIQMPAKYDAGTLWELVGFRPDPPFHLVQDANAWMLMRRQPTLLQASMFRKSSLEKVGGLSEKLRLSHDVQLFCKLGIGGTACAVSGVGCIRTMDDQSNITLNNQIPSGSECHIKDQCQLWQEILLLQKKLPPPFRRLVRFNLASSHLGMCIVKSDPELVLRIARKRNSDGYASKVRHSP